MSQQQKVQKLKSERVQSPVVMRKKRPPLLRPPLEETLAAAPAASPVLAEERLKSERVQQRLKLIPGWRLMPGGRAIDRLKEFPRADMALSFLCHAALLASGADLTVRLTLIGNQVAVVLAAPPRRHGYAPLTEPVLDLAELLG